MASSKCVNVLSKQTRGTDVHGLNDARDHETPMPRLRFAQSVLGLPPDKLVVPTLTAQTGPVCTKHHCHASKFEARGQPSLESEVFFGNAFVLGVVFFATVVGGRPAGPRAQKKESCIFYFLFFFFFEPTRRQN